MLTRSFFNRKRTAISGFSLVELLVTVGVLAVLAAAAAPNFSTLMANQKVRTGAEGILNGLQLAQAEAVNRNTNVTFTLGSGTAWTVGQVIPASVIQSRPGNESGTGLTITTLNNRTAVSFTALGSVADPDPAVSLSQVTIAPPSSVTGVDTLRIDIMAGGQLRMCNLSITAANDPRRC